MPGRQRLSVAAALLAGAALAAPVQGAAQTTASHPPLRICADPDNLPFSSSQPGTPGLYLELGADIARALDRPFEALYTVSYFGKRTVRTTLLAGKCDAYIGLPDSADFMGPQLVFSKPFLQIAYALMAPPGLPIHRLDDLVGKAVAVQFSTPPQVLLAGRDDIRGVTFTNPEDAAEALIEHRVDAAFIWGPVAGYINATTLHGGYQVMPVTGEDMQWPVSIGFAKGNTALRDQVDSYLATHASRIADLAAKYGLPVAVGADPAVPVIKIAADTSAPQTVASMAEPAPPTNAGTGDEVAAGREIFNGTCGHCHGPDAVQSERRINLRLLEHRYGDKMTEVFHYTVTHGRLDKGMPNWTGVFSEDDFSKILAFLKTVQTN